MDEGGKMGVLTSYLPSASTLLTAVGEALNWAFPVLATMFGIGLAIRLALGRRKGRL